MGRVVRTGLTWATAVVLVVPGLLLGYVYVATVASSDLHGRCSEVHLELFEDGEVLLAQRQWFPPAAISCTIRHSSGVSRAERPTGATGMFLYMLAFNGGAATLVITEARRLRRVARAVPNAG